MSKEAERIARLEEKVDNAQKRLDSIDRKLDDLPETLKKLFDERYASRKVVEDMQETVKPLTKLRKRVWAMAVVMVFSFGIIATLVFNTIKVKLGLGQ